MGLVSEQCCMLFVYLSFLIILPHFLVLFIRPNWDMAKVWFFCLASSKAKGCFPFQSPQSQLFSNLCFWFVQALGNDSSGKEKGLVESSGGRGREGQRERDRGMGWRKRKRRRKSTRTWNYLTHPLALSLSCTHTKTQKRLTGWSFKGLASLFPSSGEEFQCSISFFIGGLRRARRLGQDECVFFQWSTSVPWRPSYSADVFL